MGRPYNCGPDYQVHRQSRQRVDSARCLTDLVTGYWLLIAEW